jgi:hypothetical protein
MSDWRAATAPFLRVGPDLFVGAQHCRSSTHGQANFAT